MADKLNGCIFWLKRKHNTIWDEVSADIKKEFDGKTVYNKEFLNQNKISWWWSYRLLW